MKIKRIPAATQRLVLILWLAVQSSASAEFAITEFLADSSGTTLADEDGFPADWLEIQNQGVVAASVGGYFLTDNPANLTKWMLPDVTVPANGYLTVFATGKNRSVVGSPLHANFSLGAGGEFLALVQPDGETIVSSFAPEFPEQLRDISYGIGNGGALSGQTLISGTDTIKYFPPTAAVPGWEALAFDDGAWATVSNGVGWGYADLPGGASGSTFEAEVRLNRALADRGSVYLRMPFEIAEVADVVTMTMEILYEDGYVIYLNGTEVAASNKPNPLAWNSVTGVSIEEDNGPDFVPVNFAGLLVNGTNVLAIQAINNSTGSSDFYFQLQLAAEVQDSAAAPMAGYFETPTPGAPNGLLSLAPPNLVQFSVPSRAFTANFPLTLSVDTPGAVIRYTLDGSAPTNNVVAPSPQYTDPIAINGSTLVRAAAFLPGAVAGPGRTEGYLKLATSEAGFSSNLPVVMLSTFGNGAPPESDSTIRKDVFMLIYEPDPVTGRTTLSGVPALATRAGYRKRGSSSAGFPKYALSLESWDEFGQDKDIRPLGFSSEADWILNSRYTFDVSLIRNPFLYELSNQIDRWAVKTKFIEIYNDVTGGDVAAADYFGVYCFMEKIEPGNGRLDIPSLKPWDNAEPELTGGYVFKSDRADPGEPTFTINSMGVMVHGDPDGVFITPTQKSYLINYCNEMDAALSAPSGINPVTGKHYSEYMDVPSFIDNFWLNILSMDPDWGRLSQYFYKDRSGKIFGGPIWDYDRTMGSRDGRDDTPLRWDAGDSETWYDSEYPWFGKLFGFTSNNQPTPGASSTRPDQMQEVIDRWYQLREAQFSLSNLDAIVDSMAAEIAESQGRNFARWTGLNPGTGISGINYAAAGTTGWEREISHLKGWLKARAEWIDQQFLIPPSFNQDGGIVPAGFELIMNSDQAAVYYTTDGSDPRAPGGGISGSATLFDGGPITQILIEDEADWKFFVPLDASLESTWFNLGFDASAWTTAPTGIGFESVGGTLESEINTAPESQIKSHMVPSANGLNNASCYFRHEFEFNNVENINSLLLEVKYDDAFVAYLNGTEVARSVSAPAVIGWNVDGSSGPADTVVAAYSFNTINDNSSFDFDLTAFASLMVNGTNVLAIQGINSTPSGSDFLLKPQLSVNHTVVASPITLNETTTVIARAFDGQQWGAPTRATFLIDAALADASNLVVSEVMYNPAPLSASELTAGFVDADQFEYIELLNISAGTVDLSEVTFVGGVDFDFAGAAVTSLPSGGRALIVADASAMIARYGSGVTAFIAGTFANGTGIANGGERLALVGANGVIRDFTYDDRYPWPESPDGDGPGLVLIAPTSNPDHGVASNWRAGSGALGSPGAGDETAFVGDPTADLDGDGLSAFAEYAFGTSDTSPAAGRGVLIANFTEDGRFTVTYPVNLAAEDALIAIELSGDLDTWTAALGTFEFLSEVYNPDGTATFTFRTMAPITAQDRLYVRLRVSTR